MKKLKVFSKSQFKQFVDQNSPDQAAEIQKNWRKKTKQAKNKLLARMLIIVTLVITIIFVITVNFFIDNKMSHAILDQDQNGYTLVQSNFAHLKVLVNNQLQTYQTKMVRSLGCVYAELVSWIQANLPSNSKVLYIPNQSSGTTMLGMALGYYLSTQKGDQLDIMVNTDSYKQHLTKNTEQMKNFKNQQIVFNFLNNQNTLTKDYNLIIVENNDYLQQIQLTRFKRVVQIRKREWDSIAINNYMKNYTKYEINKGKFNSQTLVFGQFKSYSLAQLRESSREEYKIILTLVKPQPNINLCPQKIQYFRISSEKRNLLQYFRNKTLEPQEFLFYCLNDTHTLKTITQLENIVNFFIAGQNAIQSIREQKFPYDPQLKHTYILSWSDFNSFKDKIKGKILILINSPQEAAQIATLTESSPLNFIMPFNNNGCLYPVRVLPYQSIKAFHPFFLVLTKN